MAVSSTNDFQATVDKSYDKMSELQALEDTEAGVKGLVDAGITEVPRMFIQPQKIQESLNSCCATKFIFPVIDLEGFDKDPMKHKDIVDKVRDASETWGFFQVINHGIPLPVREEILQGTRRFFEQDIEIKKRYYTRDNNKVVVHSNNHDVFSPSVPATNWRDSFVCLMAPNYPSPEELPAACRCEPAEAGVTRRSGWKWNGRVRNRRCDGFPAPARLQMRSGQRRNRLGQLEEDRISALVRPMLWMYRPVIGYGRLRERAPRKVV
uniref:1-aminocyclopropane-1-carboxylate oxidase homolog n=1 Tax=Nicotiana tabacum TaxID=4097 RepID=A0A1S4CQQ7_TOBAC|nr:PREDICTED: 1-aminocyclopropane-1-carboxylate oxidase homolog [Nicotiana tabacum]